MTREAVPGGRGRVRGAVAVAAGILASRLAGLVRQKVLAWYLGAGDAADAFTQAVRIPNLLQNLFGEGALSASFIPVYARLRATGDEEARREVAGAVLGLLGVGIAVAVLLGVVGAPWIVDVLVPGFSGAKRDLTVQLVRILFPGAGLLVVSAWCLGVLNSHGRFFLSYASPVVWNGAMIVALLAWGGTAGAEQLVVMTAWASVVGSALQVVVQWPAVRGVLGALRLSLRRDTPAVAQVFRNFRPAFIGRGISQLSAFIDVSAASFLVSGSATILGNAQVLYMLPVSLFGMSVSAAALPEMSGTADGSEGARRVRAQLDDHLAQVAFLVIPSVLALMVLGDFVVRVLFQGGAFGAREGRWLHGVVGAASVGLLGATLGRLYSTTLFALQDTRTPQRIAFLRVLVGGTLGVTGALWGVPRLGWNPETAVGVLALGSGLGAWLEWAMLRRAVAARLGAGAPRGSDVVRMWAAGILAAGVVRTAAWFLTWDDRWGMPVSLVALGAFGVLYLGVAHLLGLAGPRRLVARVRGRG